MISNVFLWFNVFGLSGFFNPDLRQYTFRNPDFSALPRCCVLECTDWSQEKFGTFQTQHKSAHDHQRTFTVKITTATTAATFDS